MKNKKITLLLVAVLLITLLAACLTACNKSKDGKGEINARPEVVSATELTQKTNTFLHKVVWYDDSNSTRTSAKLKESAISGIIANFYANLEKAGFYKTKGDAFNAVLEKSITNTAISKMDYTAIKNLVYDVLDAGLTSDDVGTIVECAVNAIADINVKGILTSFKADAQTRLDAFVIPEGKTTEFNAYAELTYYLQRLDYSDIYGVLANRLPRIDGQRTLTEAQYNVIKNAAKILSGNDMLTFAEATEKIKTDKSITYNSNTYSTVLYYAQAFASNSRHAYENVNIAESDYANYQKLNDIADTYFEYCDDFGDNKCKIAASGLDEYAALVNKWNAACPDVQLVVPTSVDQITAAVVFDNCTKINETIFNAYCASNKLIEYRVIRSYVAYAQDTLAELAVATTDDHEITAAEIKSTYSPVLKSAAVAFADIAGILNDVKGNVTSVLENKLTESDFNAIIAAAKSSVDSLGKYFSANKDVIATAAAAIDGYSYKNVIFAGDIVVSNSNLGTIADIVGCLSDVVPQATTLINNVLSCLDVDTVKNIFSLTAENAVTENLAIYAANTAVKLLDVYTEDATVDFVMNLFNDLPFSIDSSLMYTVYHKLFSAFVDATDAATMSYYTDLGYALNEFKVSYYRGKDCTSEYKDLTDLVKIYGQELTDKSGETPAGENEFKNAEKVEAFIAAYEKKLATVKKQAALSLETTIRSAYSVVSQNIDGIKAIAAVAPVTYDAETKAPDATKLAALDKAVKVVTDNFKVTDPLSYVNNYANMLINYLTMEFNLDGDKYADATALTLGTVLTYTDTPVSGLFKYTPDSNITLKITVDSSNIEVNYASGSTLYYSMAVSGDNAYCQYKLTAGIDYYFTITNSAQTVTFSTVTE